MQKKKIMLVFGTRPEAIKMAPLYHALKAQPDVFETVLCVTAQHRQMLDQVLNVFDMKPDIDLNLMMPGQDLFDVTAAVLKGMRNVLKAHQPVALLVHGDTTTTLAAAMAGFYSGVPVGHVEAGLRTHDLQAPFPEEFNRQVASKLTKWHFAPTEFSQSNLLAEGVPQSSITVTGNTVIDALFWVLGRIEEDQTRRQGLVAFLTEQLGFDWQGQRFVLMTGHRRENFGDGFLQICHALKELAARYPAVRFVYPVHLNPNVQQPVNAILADVPNMHLIPPLDYEPFVYLMKHSHIVLTDSGGIQEEAPSLGKPVLVMRDVTERPEAVKAGTVRLVGADRGRIVTSVAELLDNDACYTAMAKAHNPYGEGRACARIVSILRDI
ncbi:non-hydrolyzing UDP-N-acetylglucosamine 2-epimerase [Limnohabitans sp.]|uniref:non-hydrolyzing UDP-N-acetylglucosamine 2-epimerase n=1 Tax=Limnohabitans sp. TaxID=1907725 RepID=UPI002FDEBE11